MLEVDGSVLALSSSLIISIASLSCSSERDSICSCVQSWYSFIGASLLSFARFASNDTQLVSVYHLKNSKTERKENKKPFTFLVSAIVGVTVGVTVQTRPTKVGVTDLNTFPERTRVFGVRAGAARVIPRDYLLEQIESISKGDPCFLANIARVRAIYGSLSDVTARTVKPSDLLRHC